MEQPQGQQNPSHNPPNAAKAAAARPQSAPQEAKNYDMIEYKPIMGDNIEVTWNGILFAGNIPVKVLKSVTIKVPMPVRSPMKDEDGKQMFEEEENGDAKLDAHGKKIPRYHNGHLQPDGTLQTRMVETDVPMVQLAKGNCRFSVNGAPPAFTDKKSVVRVPETVAEYRKYAMDWIAGANNKHNMTQRWKSEAPLRADLGWQAADDDYLMPFFNARLIQAAA